MKKTLTTESIISELLADQYAAWTYAGARALAEYLEEYEEDTGEEMELDTVAIRCDYGQWEDLEDFLSDCFGQDESGANSAIGADGSEDDDERAELIRNYIQENGTLIEFEGGIIVSSF